MKRLVMLDEEPQDLLKERITSIDALRGFAMFWIIGGEMLFSSLAKVWKNPLTETISQQLSHAKWEGFHFQDLIFPLFLFILGAVLPFSFAKRTQRGESSDKIYLHILKRSAVLLLLGLVYYNLLDFRWQALGWFPYGVLPRVAFCYFFAAIIVMNTSWRAQMIIVEVILVGYWLASILVPVPGYGAGVFEKAGCLAFYLDRVLLGAGGVNEGFISTFPAVCTTLLGALAGHWLRSNRPSRRKIAGLVAAGLFCLVVGYFWGRFFPINKKLWTSSYVLFAGGWSLLLMALFYWIIDVKGYKKWAFFFVVIGVNAITIYFIRKVVDFGGISQFFLNGIAERSGSVKPIILPLGTVMAEWLFLWFLYRRKIFFKV